VACGNRDNPHDLVIAGTARADGLVMGVCRAGTPLGALPAPTDACNEGCGR
jgi:hypothetical protein